VNNVDSFNNKIKDYVKKYNQIPEELKQYKKILAAKDEVNGLFNKKILKKSHLYTGLYRTDVLQKIAFDMFCSSLSNNKNSDKKLIMNTIKGNLKIKS
jgi:hypothetical protein